MSSAQLLAENLRRLRLRANLTQEQMAEVTGFSLKFYQRLESGRKRVFTIETVERLGKPFGLDAWPLLAPAAVFQRARIKMPRAKTPSPRGPRANWKGVAKR